MKSTTDKNNYDLGLKAIQVLETGDVSSARVNASVLGRQMSVDTALYFYRLMVGSCYNYSSCAYLSMFLVRQ